MPTFDVAHIREQGVDLIIVPRSRVRLEVSRSAGQHRVNSADARIGGWPRGTCRTGLGRWQRPHGISRAAQLASLLQEHRPRFVHLNLNRRLSW